MPIYEFECRRCSHVSEIYFRRHDRVPARPPCKACGSHDTQKLVSRCNHKVSVKGRYSEDFVERSIPFLKSRRELGGMLQADSRESEEAKAMRLSEKIGKGIDRALIRRISKTKR